MAPRLRGPGRLPSYILAVWLLGHAHAVLAVEPLRMLVLFGATDVSVWTQRFSTALFQHPAVRNGNPPVSVSVEYLGLHNADPDDVDTVLEVLAYKQRNVPADVVVAVQGVAARFLADYGDRIFAGVPRLLVLPGREVAGQVSGRPDIRVLRSAIRDAIPQTVTLMDTVMPRLDEILVITGAGDLDAVYSDFAHSTLASHPAADRVRHLHGLPLPELRNRLARAPSGSGALLLTYDADPDGRVYRTGDVLPDLAATSAIPIFVAYDTLLGRGAVGGVMTSTERYGEQTAAIALDMIGGAERTPAQPSPATRTAFDAVAVRRAGLDRSRLPAASELINDRRPAYLAYLQEILVALAIIMLQLVLIVALWQLLSQRKRAARALTGQAVDLERQMVLFESVINSIPDAIVITSVDARIVATNRQGFLATFGYLPDAIVGRHCGVLAGSGELDELERALGAGRPVLQFSGEPGRFPGEWSGTRILTEAGEHLGYVLVIRDITERLAHEEERRQAHKMEALGSLAGGIAHDFNNILAVMLGNAELIQAGASDTGESADQIVRAGHRARELVAQILAFSRKGSASELVPLHVRTLLEEAAGFIRASLPGSVSLRVEIPDDLEAVVQGNASQLQQVLLNLSANARDAMKEVGGELLILVYERALSRGTVVSHGILRRGRYVCIEMTDTGQGMNAALLERVFDPFFTTKGPGEGTGMGLALVYGIVHAHDGAIHVDSSPGRGTTFEILLPARSDACAVTEEGAADAPRGHGQSVLVVETDDSVRVMLDGMLERLGYRATSHADPRSALAAFTVAPHDYALVLASCGIASMDGVALCRALRQVSPGVPVLLCSGYSATVQADVRAQHEPVDFLAKPYRGAELARALQPLLERSARHDGGPLEQKPVQRSAADTR